MQEFDQSTAQDNTAIHEVLDNAKNQANEFILDLFQKSKEEFDKQNEELRSQLQEMKFSSLSFLDRITELERVEMDTLESKKLKLKEMEEERVKVIEQQISKISNTIRGTPLEDMMNIKSKLLEKIDEYHKEILQIQRHIEEISIHMEPFNREMEGINNMIVVL